MRNLKDEKMDFATRFYCDRAVNRSLVEALVARGGEIRWRDHRPDRPWLSLLWRFEAADDPTVDRFLSRDCDSRPSSREPTAVEDWIASGKAVHVIRDHLCHVDLILAGLWGGVGGLLPAVATKAEAFVRFDSRRWIDQQFLAQYLWPQVKQEALIHDSNYALFGARPLAGPITESVHLGACHAPNVADPDFAVTER